MAEDGCGEAVDRNLDENFGFGDGKGYSVLAIKSWRRMVVERL